MSYQVLARKWRPKTFQDMVGQEHVLKALVHALDHERLHHAYLFTGTRGVGKTTIGRLLARCLNCETGITSTPCGECDSCQEILGGRFVDLIEIDAASRTKVEDMRELLDNVQYSPTRGRFKIYLIDEVHMLSNSSFNALLKTLEEPPDHVKFLFATTDPQKLPVTILSRCLQFNLKRMTPEHIVGHLNYVLNEEAIPFEDPALWLLARAADGSMRDALSLTDQAIAFGNQKLAASDVSAMLGTIDQRDIQQIVAALVKGDGPAMLSEVNRIAEFAPDYSVILSDLLSLFHRVTLEQVVPGSADNAMGDADQVKAIARQLSGEDAQLFYQAALVGRKDLTITPDARMGFEMALLRMLTFRPGSDRRDPPAIKSGGGEQGSEGSRKDDPEPAPAATDTPVSEPTAAEKQQPVVQEPANRAPEPVADAQVARPEPEPEPPSSPVTDTSDDQTAGGAEASAPPDSSENALTPPETAESPDTESVPLSAYDDPSLTANDADGIELPETPHPVRAEVQPESHTGEFAEEKTTASIPVEPQQSDVTPVPQAAPDVAPTPRSEPAAPKGVIDPSAFEWQRDFRTLGLTGMAGNLASQGSFDKSGDKATLTLDSGHARLLNDRHRARIEEALKAFFGDSVRLAVQEGEPGDSTPAAFAERARLARQQAAESSIAEDPLVQNIVQRFDGAIVDGSIEPVK